MKRIHVLAVALVAVFVASVAVVSTASAVEFLLALWLEGTTGTPVTATLAVKQEGEVEFIDRETIFGESKILCSGIFLGDVGPESKGHVNELLNLVKEQISKTALVELGLACTDLTGFCSEPLVWAEGLPWETEAELMVEGEETFFTDLILKLELEVKCMAGAFITEDLCEWPTVAAKLTNEAGGVVDAEFSEAFQELAGLELGRCLGREKSAIINGLTTISEAGVTLTVSE